MPTVAAESPQQPDVLELLRLGDEYAVATYPEGSDYSLSIAELDATNITFLVARHEGQAVGTVAFVDRGDGTAEMKRMFVRATARRLGVAGALIVALEDAARAASITLVQLETGPPEAVALYEKYGYRHIPNFGRYIGDDTSVCMEKPLPA